MAFSFHVGVKAVVLVSFVFDNPDGAVRLVEGIVSFYLVTVPFLFLLMDVVVLWIVHFIFEFVVRISEEVHIFVYMMMLSADIGDNRQKYKNYTFVAD